MLLRSVACLLLLSGTLFAHTQSLTPLRQNTSLQPGQAFTLASHNPANALSLGTETGAAATPIAVVAAPTHLSDVFGVSSAVKSLEQSLAPYLAVAAAREGGLLQPLNSTATDSSGAPRPEFRIGDDLVVMPGKSYTDHVSVTLPDGVWVNYWTGAQVMGGGTIAMDVAGGSFPMWARGGSVLTRRTGGYDGVSMIEKRLTDSSTTCGKNCLYEVMPAFNEATAIVEKDSDGRTLTRMPTQLRIAGAETRAVVRWRFTRVTDVFLNGSRIPVQISPDGYYASFDHKADSTVEWTVLSYMPRSY